MAASDLDSVMRVERLAFKNPWSPELFQRELLHDWSTILIAAPTGTGPGEPAIYGFVIYWSVHDEQHILNIATDPLHRRKSVARRLMVAAIEQGRARGARLVTLEVRRSNLPAITLYRDLGFRAVGIRPNYYADEGEDAVVMNLDL
jgi:ribosomal-protein-alanine N-acetyltransferase